MKLKKGCLITIGSFDGVHLGHMALLDRTVLEARKRKVKSVALTFNVPPRMVLNKAEPVMVLSDPAEKKILIKSRGIDEVVVLDFDRDFSKTKAYPFFRDILLKKFQAKGIVVGMDFRFGVGRSAGAMELLRWGQELRIPVWIIPQVKLGNTPVSSSEIRRLLLKNEFNKALHLMGHPYLIHGPVVKGHGLGRKIGFPTTNVLSAIGKALPQGVYVVRGVSDGPKKTILNGVCNIGHRPTFYKKSPIVIEPHWFGGDLKKTPKTLSLQLLHRLRDEKKFSTVEALRKAIASDVRRAQSFFEEKGQIGTDFTPK